MISGKVGILVSLFPVSKKNVTYLVLKEETLQKIQVTVVQREGKKEGESKRMRQTSGRKWALFFSLRYLRKKKENIYLLGKRR